MVDILNNNDHKVQLELEDRSLLIDRIKYSYLSLNLYRHSELLDGLTTTCAFENDLDIENFRGLSLTHFFIKCYQSELHEVLPQLMKNFSRNTNIQQIETRGYIRGAIDWNATYKRRMAVGYDPALFICKPSNRIYDIPENQLTKYLLHFIHNNIDKVEKIAPGKIAGWTMMLEKIKQSIKKFLHHPIFAEVTLPDRLGYTLITKSKKSRNPHYRTIGLLTEYLYNLFVLNDKKTLFEVLSQQLLVPIKTDKIFEFVVYFEVIQVLESLKKKYHGKRQISLLRADYKTVFEYFLTDINTNVKIYYQNVPEEYSNSSNYKQILQKYSVPNVKSNIPDIIIVIEDLNQHLSRTALMEIKYGREQSYLLGNGLRDTLGYLKDFEDILNNKPSALLATYTGEITRPEKSVEQKQNVWITNSNQLNSSLSDFINKLI
ncbi:hypothetical protein GCM10011351_28360 [Paraliobacillus quinghaiensis]|uniref:Uncharacterized protein n=1 Tax=Paraliobacillus quinghaiensis TaxID=470815 RepID=A0A917WXZ1_9BACI|nr:hypothetical protein [Paraliobacillus quinghaiensis]GGM40522.1 hypothetical protein GCM10011351_28360 [Paraliobacillus quinghaiensis]